MRRPKVRWAVVCALALPMAGATAPTLRIPTISLSNEGFLSVTNHRNLVSQGMAQFAELSEDDILAARQHVLCLGHPLAKPSVQATSQH